MKISFLDQLFIDITFRLWNSKQKVLFNIFFCSIFIWFMWSNLIINKILIAIFNLKWILEFHNITVFRNCRNIWLLNNSNIATLNLINIESYIALPLSYFLFKTIFYIKKLKFNIENEFKSDNYFLN